MKNFKTLIATAFEALLAGAAQAGITIGVSLPLTGPASGLGSPMKNQIALWPQSIGGEKLRVIILHDATDPTNGVKNARRFVTDDKVDLIVGSAATLVGIAMADVAIESQTPQLLATPAQLPPGKDAWSFRLPQSNAVNIARLGMSRTFQHVKMIPDMTVLENVALGAHLRGAKGVLSAMTRLNRLEERQLFSEAQRQLERIGMGAHLHE